MRVETPFKGVKGWLSGFSPILLTIVQIKSVPSRQFHAPYPLTSKVDSFTVTTLVVHRKLPFSPSPQSLLFLCRQELIWRGGTLRLSHFALCCQTVCSRDKNHAKNRGTGIA